MWRRIRIAALLAPVLVASWYGARLLPIRIPVTDLREQGISCPEGLACTLELRIFPPWTAYFGRHPYVSLWTLDDPPKWIPVASDSVGRARVTNVPPGKYCFSWGTGQGYLSRMEIEAVAGRTLGYRMIHDRTSR